MVTIIGNGMGDYDFKNISLDISSFHKVICDKNFKKDGANILKLGFKDAKEYILENYKKDLLYVVTGSPYFYSAGILLAKKLPKEYVTIISNTSSKEYMQEKFLINDKDISSISLHGRSTIDLENFLTNIYTLVLCDKDTIPKIKEAIKYLQPNDLEVIIGYKLGYEDEIIEQINIFDYSYNAFDMDQPYVLLIKRLYEIETISKDDDFITQRGMITKQYKRELSLQLLDLKPNQLLWDIGAGSGSCGIQAYKRYKVRTIFFENQELRVENIKQNLSNHKVVDTLLLEGNAQDYFETLKIDPDKIFVGGGGEKVIEKLPYLYERLNLYGIMLINAITLKHLTLMLNILNQHNIEYEVFSLSLTTYKGSLDLVEPQRQLFSIKIYKDKI